MKATELRIGNKVLNDRCKNTVIRIYENIVTLKTKQGNEIISSLDLIEPIEITEEILFTLNFIKCNGKYGEYFKHNICTLFRIWFFDGEFKEIWEVGKKDESLDTTTLIASLKYVHQLQNLYFSLTNEELTFIE